MLRILCVLLKVLILMKADIAFSSENLEDSVVIHYVYNQSKLERVENYIDNVTVKNEIEEKAPSEPTSPKVFMEYENKLTKKGNIIVKFRWNEPQSTYGKILKYTIRYWYITQRKYIHYIHNIPVTEIMITVTNISDSMMHFQVQAHNANGASPYTKFINVSTMHETPVPLLLISSSRNRIRIIDTDSEKILTIFLHENANEIIYSSLEHKIYWINELSELISCELNKTTMTIQNYTKIAVLDITARNLCIDWIRRNLYWIQFSSYGFGDIMKLDLTLWEQIGEAKYDSIIEINKSQFLNILPFEGYFYWMELNSNNQYAIRQSDLDGKNIKTFLEDKNDNCSCPYKLREASSMQIDNTNIGKPTMYWISNNHLIKTEIYGCGCDLLFRARNKTCFKYLTIDKTNIYLISEQKSDNIIDIFIKEYAPLKNKENAFKHGHKDITASYDINSVIALAPLQPYPRTICLIPKTKNYGIEVIRTTNNSIAVTLPEPDLHDGCDKYHLPTTIYNISVSHCLDNDLNKFNNFNVLTHERYYEIKNLTPLTEYKLKLALSNFYVDKLSMNSQFGDDILLKTNASNLNMPENVTVQVLTSTQVAVYWMPPKNLNCVAVNYEVRWIYVPSTNHMYNQSYPTFSRQISNKFERTVDRKFFTIIERLQPEQVYLIYVRVSPVNFNDFFNYSLYESVYMYSEPNNLTLSGVSTNSMNISWIPSANMISYTLEYKNVMTQEWKLADNIEKNNDTVTHYLENLHPGTLYNFRLILRYLKYMKGITWPPNETFIFGTLDDIPSAPGRPQITSLSNSTHKTLEWNPAQVHDSQVISYYLEGLIVENNYKNENQTNNWKLYYNGTDNHWLITEGMNQKYQFRVHAKNAYSSGNWSETSAVVDMTEFKEILAAHYYYPPFILSLIVTLVVYSIYYFLCSYGQRKGTNNNQILSARMTDIELATQTEMVLEHKSEGINTQVLPATMTDIELATQTEMSLEHKSEGINTQVLPATMTDIELAARNETSFEYIQHNKLYDSKLQHDLNKYNLKIIGIEHITSEKLLGSGQFGKVFQGIVKNLEESGSIPVAIKMLRENAFSEDKEKFLQEAKLMSHFHHKHVLRLLGICLDIDSPMLILDLMEGGDLLKYLEESRILPSSDPNSLRLQDLLAMCEDVARGCCYLEELHFVHRDLACRNCLISTRNRENRIVKISDFGLSRNLYNKAYYHMEGKDPFPIRWMAPESIQYRNFTSQSDVWSFGVIMWEITSMGEHPYSDIGDSEVWPYVRAGGKLTKPLNCPLKLYQLMQHCWSTVDNRPNFMHCLQNIVTLKDNIGDANLILAADIIKYAEPPSSGESEEFVEYVTHPTSEH